ncbi:fungal-specific transcription factor domain-containing protein [Aspergillus cavernicola]|uniref:Fungal-specific transcription factor domain-containing protein n=1 Tax=Aspergillus cavernicola TaxID=176166 RepID=A0ABR4IQN4_9EURO
MSLSQAASTPYQPFQCLICQSRFTRHENLKRHALLHTRSHDHAALPCDFCQATFSRADLRRRHMKRKHPEQEQRRARKRAQRDSPSPRLWDDEGNECSVSPPDSHDSLDPEREMQMDSSWNRALRHAQLDQSTVLNRALGTEERAQSITELVEQAMNEPRVDGIGQDVMDLQNLLQTGPSLFKSGHEISQPSPDSLTGFNFTPNIHDTFSPSYEDWSPSSIQIRRGCELFFAHVSHFVPFLHEPTFNPNQAPLHLILSMLCLAYQYGDDPEHNQSSFDVNLPRLCFNRARALITEVTSDNISIVQSYLLLQICAMMYLCGSDSAHALKMHSSIISLARSGGLMQPTPVESAATQDLDTLWREFIKAESHKRTLLAVHQIDALWYQFLSIPRSISHLEIKHDLPCPEGHWTASSAAEWAHRQLVARQGPAVQYADAVRRFLSQDSSDLATIPSFDPYGAINITQFLISSAREISGWSTMTGMLSIDRFGALRSSLVALNPYICPPKTTHHPPGTGTNALCAATWETAMIELQIWSPSHTSGIVEASIDAVLNQSTYLSPSGDILCEDLTAKAIQPHVDWFLRYLDTTVTPEGEAPWVALYAYKAFLIAWQLVKGRLPGAMAVVGIRDEDVSGALRWARTVFRRRDRWQIGKLIMACLNSLSADT